MSRGGSHVDPVVQNGKRSCVWFSYVYGRKRGPYGSGARVATEAEREGWSIRASVPRLYRYGEAAGKTHWPKKVHIVRDVVIATKGDVEVRLTWWLCGAQTFHARLTKDPPSMVCAKCLLVESGRSVARLRR